ncbi:MAG TPA: hypothetical protein VHT52_20790 [Stellaceae bacterium]|jgi:hypothetical protein|nr:hypothetical protein [Stellaceae bacterium]
MPTKTALRVLSDRATLIVDNRSHALIDTAIISGLFASPGVRGLIGDDQLLATRIIDALPTNKSNPVQVEAAELMRDDDGCYLADPDGNLVGAPGLFVHRMLYAERVWDMRRFG